MEGARIFHFWASYIWTHVHDDFFISFSILDNGLD